MIVGKLVVLFILFVCVYMFGYIRGYDDVTHISNWGIGWDSGYECGWKLGYVASLCRRKDITGREMKRVYRIKRKYAPKEIIADEVAELPSVPAVPLDKLCVLLKELNESGYSFQCAFCKKAFPAWCDEKNTDIGWDRELQCPTWEEITEWMVKLDDNNGTD